MPRARTHPDGAARRHGGDRLAKEYRSRARILLDLMRAVRDEGPVGVTRLLLLANLSHPRLTEYLDELEAKGWVEPVQVEGRKTWKVTARGLEVIAELARIDRVMTDFGLGL